MRSATRAAAPTLSPRRVGVLVFVGVLAALLPGRVRGGEAPGRSLAEPFQIVAPAPNKQLVVNEGGLVRLASLSGPVAVVGVVGPFHSGKSFLMNALLNNTKGFEVGSSVNPTTRGIWAMDTGLSASGGARLVFVDTEGFFDPGASEEYDAKVFALTTLLSSHVLYNSMKMIDHASVDYLELLARRTQLFNLKNKLKSDARSGSSEDGETSGETKQAAALRQQDFPGLTWVLEDFTLNLGGRSCSEWLGEFLVTDYNKKAELLRTTNGSPPSGLRDVFNGVDCHPVFLPHTDLDKLQDLSSVETTSELTDRFNKDIASLRDTILAVAPKQTSLGNLTGMSLAMLVRLLVQSANDHTFPSLPSLWETWYSKLGNSAFDLTVAHVDQTFSHALAPAVPQTPARFESTLAATREEALSLYKESCFGFEHLYTPKLAKLEEELDRKAKAAMDSNNQKIEQLIAAKLAAIKDEIVSGLKQTTLPIPDAGVDDLQNASVDELASRAKAALADFEATPAFKEQLRQAVDAVEQTAHGVRVKNLQQVLAVLKACADEHANAVATLLDSQDYSKALGHNQMLELRARLDKAALDAFHARIGEGRQWLHDERQFALELSMATTKLETAWLEFEKANADTVAAALRTETDMALARFETRQQDIRPFPDEPEPILAKVSVIISDIRKQFETSLASLNDTAQYARALDALLLRLDRDTVELVLDRNVKESGAKSHSVRRCLLQELAHEPGCIICTRAWLPFAYRSHVIARGMECFARKDSIHFSENLKRQVVQAWLREDDLKQWERVVMGKLGVLLLAIAVATRALWKFLRKVHND